MSGEGNTREGRLKGQHLELCAPGPFPEYGIFQKLPEDALTPCAVFNLAIGLHSPLTHLHLTSNSQKQVHDVHFPYSDCIPCYRPQTYCQYTSFTTVTYRSPWSHVTLHALPRTYIQVDTHLVSHKHTGFLKFIRSSRDGHFVLGPLSPVTHAQINPHPSLCRQVSLTSIPNPFGGSGFSLEVILFDSSES